MRGSATMGDMTEPATYPPCPTCNAEVVDLITHGGAEDRRFGSTQIHKIAGAKRFELYPCGHDVGGYSADANDRVLRWSA